MSKNAFLSYLSKEKNYSGHTVAAYQTDIEEFSAFLAQHHDGQLLENVAYPLVRDWIVFLVGKGVSNRTVNRKISALKAYYRFLQKSNVIDHNPLGKHRALKVERKIEIPFSVAEMETVLASLPFEKDFEGYRDRLVIELLYATGIRRAELVNLKCADVDLANNTIKVLGKRNKERYLPILSQLKNTLNDYLLHRNSLGFIENDAFLLLTKNGHKIYETLVYRVINKYLGLASVKVKKSPHILRHTFATHLLGKGADLNAVKELLGHASLASTQVYTHSSISELKRVHQTAHPRSKE
ncbi:Tyrosine recombinase XerC [Croceitalea dokdonensis DOKDO 023]|uniref:Tyrosine recombinase XerC n=1 Tax=Croceitalea dokdonensis DOKDO 023 TaxID=1300341 RepID=A0A0N8H3X7_9FLAO|nr:tyrosine-type recombinase/integrase [Croceitalea dokdonensis]KPM31804.1 Tyrosine recombinase XerC [Croceitalea dokdonensis DOKDO 023]